jgi:uncharacterized protein YbjT (DUF2867 family)
LINPLKFLATHENLMNSTDYWISAESKRLSSGRR